MSKIVIRINQFSEYHFICILVLSLARRGRRGWCACCRRWWWGRGRSGAARSTSPARRPGTGCSQSCTLKLKSNEVLMNMFKEMCGWQTWTWGCILLCDILGFFKNLWIPPQLFPALTWRARSRWSRCCPVCPSWPAPAPARPPCRSAGWPGCGRRERAGWSSGRPPPPPALAALQRWTWAAAAPGWPALPPRPPPALVQIVLYQVEIVVQKKRKSNNFAKNMNTVSNITSDFSHYIFLNSLHCHLVCQFSVLFIY